LPSFIVDQIANSAIKTTIQNDNLKDLEFSNKLKEVLAKSNDLSYEAKNITIINIRNHLTLAGKVKSKEEKIKIGKIAQTLSKGKIISNILTY
jgi:osmotically-inducible protein OsmY